MCLDVCMCVRVYVRMSVCMYVCMCVCVCMHVRIYKHIYTTHKHTYVYIPQVHVFTCTVGAQPSFAAYCLYSLEDVGSLLRGMSLKIKRKMKSAATMLELTGMG